VSHVRRWWQGDKALFTPPKRDVQSARDPIHELLAVRTSAHQPCSVRARASTRLLTGAHSTGEVSFGADSPKETNGVAPRLESASAMKNRELFRAGFPSGRAATCGGKLNRPSLRRCTLMLQHLMTTFLSVWIDHGADVDWGPMCYPPLREATRSATTNGLRPKSAK